MPFSPSKKRALRQHYVPQFHLRQWATRQSPVLRVLDKTTSRLFKAHSRDVAVERFFYSQLPEAQMIEGWFTRMEGEMADVYSKISRDRDIGFLSGTDRVGVFGFVAAMLLRTREMRESVRDLIEGLGNEVARRIGVTDWEFKLTEEGALGFHIDTFQNLPLYSSILSRLELALVVNETNLPFTTSDHPVSRHNELPPRAGGGGRLGLASKGIQFHLPISPELSLLLYDGEAYGQLPSRIHVPDADFILLERRLQLTQSFRHVFSGKDDRFEDERRILREDPSIGALQRKRHEIR